MVKLRDHYFIAWLHVYKDVTYNINNNDIEVNITPQEYTKYLEEYRNSAKPLLSKVRSVVKELNNTKK